MLQRIQTLWMLLAVACGVLTLKFPFYSGTRLGASPVTPSPQYLTATGNVLLLVLTVAIVVAGLVNIFNYKNRKLQLRVTVGIMLVSLLNIFLYYQQTKNFQAGTYSLTAIFALAIPVVLVLAARGIAKDQKLIKSADRLR